MVSTDTSTAAPDAAADAAYGPDRLHVEAGGPDDAPTLVLLHGWGSRAELMRVVADGLADRWRVLNVDLPGHGLSPAPPEPWGVPEHADLVGRLIDARVGGPVTIVGHSNGGRIALYMASDDALRRHIDRLVLVSPSGITPPRTWRYHARRAAAGALKAPFQLLPGRLRDFGLDWLRHSLVWKALGSSDYRALEGVMRGTFVKTVSCHLDDRVHRVDVPTLLFWGDRDEAVARVQMRTLEERLPDAGLVVLEGAGHYGYLDDPDTFLAATRHFLEATA